ncbi:MAG: DNA polymerase III subunit gamma/tau [Gemmataceae bacterium]
MAKRKATPTDSSERSSEYTVVARRYRPQQFADLVGQEPVAQALTNAIKSGRIAHAYLFTGTRGVGKTTAARILAKALNCVKGPTPTPCDQCESCLAIAVGQDIDVLEIDGASNRGIDEIRNLRQNVQFAPSRSRYKIYIIDEVHMLTTPAFNALLKTLEEPPLHVKFIFATTDANKVPITILSRCQRFDFAGIAAPRIIDRLRAVVKGENREADDDALALVARRAAGSMRDAQSLLDQLLAFGEERLTAEQVQRLLGTASDEQVAAIAAAVLAGDAKTALALLAVGVDDGLQLGELLDQLIDYWRELMLVGCAGADVSGLSTTQSIRRAISDQAAKTTLDVVLAGLDVLHSARMQLRNSSRGRVLIEMALVRLSRLDGLISLSQIADILQTGVELSASPTPVSSRALAAEEQKKNSAELTTNRIPTPPAGPTALTIDTLADIWSAVLAQIGPVLAQNVQVAGLPAISGPNALVLQFPVEYNTQRSFCTDETRLQRVTDALRRLTGQDWAVRVESVLSRNKHTPSVIAPRTVKEMGPAIDHALLKRAADVLGAKLLQVDDSFGLMPETTTDED